MIKLKRKTVLNLVMASLFCLAPVTALLWDVMASDYPLIGERYDIETDSTYAFTPTPPATLLGLTLLSLGIMLMFLRSDET